jgi:hypothetical protein
MEVFMGLEWPKGNHRAADVQHAVEILVPQINDFLELQRHVALL